jgi:hypothetical protein
MITYCDHCEKPIDVSSYMFRNFVETSHTLWCEECKKEDNSLLGDIPAPHANYYNISHAFVRSIPKKIVQ